jgi:hypothetical protein
MTRQKPRQPDCWLYEQREWIISLLANLLPD